ncbi:jerky protein homolog-like [Dreissena polymorpha]|uniref:jerky protein homolog-like n=1 Tax=Dreissena polymorpha TaxID=45954 RepID=UPI002264CDDF|nr:jerky protein homolog-like [Dreissena polymorpha]XP_052242039.1 jerky protein homolog-like [Dreissena polymorpha]XP_052242040.1 jerky protein homolog-like [Dreissena polymorpha]XP_052242041.1 jerky protein homolog-like [Dreissena polymorpha]XP_052242042.1 jerky protein homolog-like [Dreissena polymorpha]XP_052242043.1 jerky protein homolog-like [Dreissena polymorpha]XP_052242044.1 jerky protein homolog-like [Dreissena polymorpha]XP_052242045.1 jerky protein homolog-like [Dreissena polymor
MESRKRKAYSIAEKLNVVDRLRSGEAQVSVSSDLNIAESTLRGWLKDEEKLRSSLAGMDCESSKRKRQRTAKDTQLEKAVIDWFNQERSEGTTLSGPIVQGQAKAFHQMIHGDGAGGFEGSNGWLRNFKSRHDIHEVRIRGEQRSADETAAAEYPPILKKIIDEGQYTPEQIYNADETGLYFKMLPDRTLAKRSDEQKTLGFKQAKNRLTILLCTNSTGTHKLPPLVIGKFAKPRCFHHLNMETLPVVYANSANAWMTSAIFEDWFHRHFVTAVRRHLRQQRLPTKALLLLDNCGAHPKTLASKDRKIVISFLPKNTTSKIQPMDMGIIANSKRMYRRHLVKSITARGDLSLPEFLKRRTIKEAIYMFASAWEEVSRQSIHGCWRRALGEAIVTSDDADDSDEEFEGFSAADVSRAFGVSDTDIEEWLNVDEDLPTTAHLTDNEIVANATSQCTEAEESADEDEDQEMEPVPALSSVVQGLELGLRWLETSSNGTAAQTCHLRNIIAMARAAARDSCKQRKLTDFFHSHSD